MMSVATKTDTAIPLPAMVAAVWGAFLYEGLFTSTAEPDRMQRVLDTWNQGCVELVIDTCIHLPEVWQQICAHWETNDSDFPGVFEYEVISPLGEYFAEQVLESGGKLPDATTVKAKIKELIEAFFKQERDQAPSLPDAMSPFAQALTRHQLNVIEGFLSGSSENPNPIDHQGAYEELVQLGMEAVLPLAGHEGERSVGP